VPTCLVPEREFDPVPESEFVVDDAKVIFHDILRRTDDLGHFTIFESAGDQFYDLLLARAGEAGSVEIACGHGLIRF
jgi:hypothetical protein